MRQALHTTILLLLHQANASLPTRQHSTLLRQALHTTPNLLLLLLAQASHVAHREPTRSSSSSSSAA
jgi:hypothetical protein